MLPAATGTGVEAIAPANPPMLTNIALSSNTAMVFLTLCTSFLLMVECFHHIPSHLTCLCSPRTEKCRLRHRKMCSIITDWR